MALAAALAGCASLRPDYATVGYAHQSQPMAGPGTAPWGDHNRTDETTTDALEAGLRWERGPLYFDAALGYSIWYHNVGAGPWLATFRVGARINLP